MIANLSVRHFEVPILPPSSAHLLIGLGTGKASVSLEKMYFGVADDAKSILMGLLLKTAAQVLVSAHTFGR